MTNKTWRGLPLYEAPDGKFATIDKAEWERWQAHQEEKQHWADEIASRSAKPVETEQADGTTGTDENDVDANGLADGRRVDHMDGSGRGEQGRVHANGQGSGSRPKHGLGKRGDGDDQ